MFFNNSNTMQITLGKVQKENTIIITFGDYNYKDVIVYWANKMKQLNIHNFLVIALDDEAFEYFKSNSISCILRPFKGDLGDLWVFRMDVFNEILNYGYNIIHSDADAIWLRDVTDYLTSHDHDMLFSQGTIYPVDVFSQWGFVLCCGLFYCRSNENTKSAFSQLKTYASMVKDDQVAVNRYFSTMQKIIWEDNSESKYDFQIQNNQAMTCYTEILTGRTDDLTVGLLPHALFQRINLPDSNDFAFVKHILSSKTSESKIEMFKRLGL